MDLANWMRNLPLSVRSMPLMHVAIPGSHNAMMYSVLKNSPAAPDAPRGLETMNRLFPTCVQSWLLTQTYTVRQQLEHGVRYLDIRTSYHEDRFMFCHGLYASDNLQPLEEINTFLDAHPKEMVILDFQHVYNCDRQLHQKYCDTISAIFGSKILPRSGTELARCSLNTLARQGHQVIVIYRRCSDEEKRFWCSHHFPTPWPNTMSRRRLKQILDENFELRDIDNGHVTQCVLTPTIKYILLHPFGSVKESCAKRVLRQLRDWIQGMAVGTVPAFNVFIADYVDLEEDLFTKTVIELNFQVGNYIEEARDDVKRLEVVTEEETPPEVTDLE